MLRPSRLLKVRAQVAGAIEDTLAQPIFVIGFNRGNAQHREQVAELAKTIVAIVAAECDSDDYQAIGKRHDARKRRFGPV